MMSLVHSSTHKATFQENVSHAVCYWPWKNFVVDDVQEVIPSTVIQINQELLMFLNSNGHQKL